MMADGYLKSVELIEEGDLVMGPDSKPRRVCGVTAGMDELYEITPNYCGEKWVCNSEHELHLIRTREHATGRDANWDKSGQTENITVKEYLKQAKWWKHVRKLRRVPLNFAEKPTYIDPYVYGAWLGDGHSDGVTFTNMEPEIWDYLDKWATSVGLILSDNTQQTGKAKTQRYIKSRGTGTVKRDTNFIRQFFRQRPKSNGIDPEFLINSEEVRLQVLAGLIDTDGEVNGHMNYGVITKHEQLAKCIVYLCRSLGFGAQYQTCLKGCQTGAVGTYYRVKIRGPVDRIPVKVPRKKVKRKNKFNCLQVGFSIKPIGRGIYFGFSVDSSDELFLLGDCTVAHNSTLIVNTLRTYSGITSVVTAPGLDLVRQLHDEIAKAMPDREVKLLSSDSRTKWPSEDITVCSLDSLHRCDRGRVRLVIIDEVHAAVSESRVPELLEFNLARFLGFSASPNGRYDGRDALIEGLIGPVLAERTYTEAVAEGAIVPIVAICVQCAFEPFKVSTRDKAYRDLLWQNAEIAEAIRLIWRLIPAGWQSMVFIETEKQARHLAEVLPPCAIAMDKLLSAKERKAPTEQMRQGEVIRCLASEIYATGITMHDLRMVIMAGGGGGSISAIQKPGRLAEIRPGKRAGYFVDFVFSCPTSTPALERRGNCEWRHLVRDSKARMDKYLEKGYVVYSVNSVFEIPAILAKHEKA